MRRYALVLALPALAACTGWTDQVAGPPPGNLPARAQFSAQQDVLPDRYIVVFRDDVQDPSAVADQLVAQFGGVVHFRYAYAIKGFAATLPPTSLTAIQRSPVVSYVEPDGIATISGSGLDNSVSSWGLDRVDQRDLPLSSSYQWTHDGAGVRAYIIDTGIQTTHLEFGNRATVGYDAIGDGHNGQDCNGHGTHVAGTVGGAEYGIARAASLIAVRVLNCAGSGTWSQVIAGVDWVTANRAGPAVANMSLGGGLNTALNTAVTNAVNAGVTFAVAAGNSSFDACLYSPSSTPAALTVGATTSSDARASYSNYGTCVDLFAPGSGITSAWIGSNTATNTISGTSMASPHVAGVAAIYLSANPLASPATVESAIESAATAGKVTSPGAGSPNLLLYSLVNGAGGGTNNPPTASFTYSCSSLTCNFTSTSTDGDGTITVHSWTFGDGTSSTATNPSKTYATENTYTVSLTVTDNDGATGFTSSAVTVSSGGGSGITLNAIGYKVKRRQMVDLSWSGATSSLDIYRNDVLIVTGTANDGAYTDNNVRGGGSYTYRVCLTGTQTCSNSATVTF